MQQVVQESFRSAFGEAGNFSIRRFIREKNARTLFFEYDIAAGNTLAPVFKTMLDIAMKEALGRNRSSGRVFFILDEFALLPELKHLTDGLNFGRSLGLRFVVGTQNVRQVQEMYGEHMAASVLSAFGTVFSFRLFDGVSREFVRDRFGRNRKIVRFESTVRTKGMNEISADGNVVEDWDLSSLPVGTCIAALPDNPPVRFTFALASK
jgi:type IV secretory pathway TraG/TraD family ATPase VirD4